MLFANIEGHYFTYCSVFENYLSDNLQALTRALKTVWVPYTLPAGPELTPLLLTVHHSALETWWELTTTADTNILKDPNPNAPDVASAVYSFDLPPWADGAVLHILPAQDGAFDSPQEQLQSRLDFSGLEPGRHRVFAQAYLATARRVWLPWAACWCPSRPRRPPTAVISRSYPLSLSGIYSESRYARIQLVVASSASRWCARSDARNPPPGRSARQPQHRPRASRRGVRAVIRVYIHFVGMRNFPPARAACCSGRLVGSAAVLDAQRGMEFIRSLTLAHGRHIHRHQFFHAGGDVGGAAVPDFLKVAEQETGASGRF